VALLGAERQFRGMSRRAGIFEVLEERLRTGLYANEDEAVAVLQEREKKRKELRLLEVVPDSKAYPPGGMAE
jgi:DNA sulfur modification protein DndC